MNQMNATSINKPKQAKQKYMSQVPTKWTCKLIVLSDTSCQKKDPSIACNNHLPSRRKLE